MQPLHTGCYWQSAVAVMFQSLAVKQSGPLVGSYGTNSEATVEAVALVVSVKCEPQFQICPRLQWCSVVS